MHKHIRRESQHWVDQSIITGEQQEQILALYQKTRSYSPVVLLFSILGSLLLGLGIILIFASNWESIPKAVKLCAAFAPLLLAMSTSAFVLWRKQDSAPWREGVSLALCLSIFAVIALIGQVFHTPADTAGYLRQCMFLSLPALYLFETRSPAVLYAVCMIWSMPPFPI